MEQFCQSCSMPLTEDLCGTEKDGTKSQEYCTYCYAEGEFTQDITMEEMKTFCIDMMIKEGGNPEEVTTMMNEAIPQLKRWKQL